jgi:hypothetical protein
MRPLSHACMLHACIAEAVIEVQEGVSLHCNCREGVDTRTEETESE